MTKPVVAVVVAAGSGVRLGGQVPKALRQVGGMPLVTRSANALAEGGVTHLVVVIAAGLEDDFASALAGLRVPWRLVSGGAERQDSVRNGLTAITDDPSLVDCAAVLVHDAARALVPPTVVARVITAVRAGAKVVVPVVPVVDTVRQVSDEPGEGSRVIDRTLLRAVQTPQGFDLATLVASHARLLADGVEVTDDATACERLGHRVVMVSGAREAFKVTEPFDLLVADALTKGESW